MFRILAVLCLLAIVLSSCTLSIRKPTHSPIPVAGVGSSTPIPCPVTPPLKAQPPKDPNADAFGLAYWYVNPDRTLWAGPLPDSQTWQAGGEKVIWIRPQGTQLVVSGHRLDAEALPLRAEIPCCYPTGFQASGLIFPTEGCWEVIAQAGKHELRFITQVASAEHRPR